MNSLISTFQAWYDYPIISDTKRRIRSRYWLVFLTLRFTGARISEVININYEDIDFRNAEIKVITLKRHNPKKKGQYRIIPVPSNLTGEIAHPHILRHTRTIKLLRVGALVTIVQGLLGHSTLTTMAMYFLLYFLVQTT